MAIVVPTPDQETMAAAIDRLAGLDLIERAAAARRRGDGTPVVTYSELLAYLDGRSPGRDARVQQAIRLNAAVRRRYHAMLGERAATYLPMLRAAASAPAELTRSFAVAGKRGAITVKPLTAKPGHVLLSIAYPAPPRLCSLEVVVPEDHPRLDELAGLRLRFAEPSDRTVELVLPGDDPIVAALLDPSVEIAVAIAAS